MRSAPLRPLVLAALTGTMVLVATACGSSTTSTADSTTTTASTTTTRPAPSDRDDETTDTTTRPKRTTTTEDTEDEPVDDPTADPSADAPDACDLITEADAEEAFGESPVAGPQSRDECWWSTANDLKTINLIRRTGEDLDVWRSGYDNAQWEPVDLGDEGYTGKMLDSVVFRIDDTVYEINVVYSTKGDPRAVVDELAETVFSRL